MATFYLKLDKTINTKDIKRKFDAFVELYGESEMFLQGDFDELTSSGKILPLFELNAKIEKIGTKYVNVILKDGSKAIVLISAIPQKYIVSKPQIMFISKWI